jgi:hypothetical protein
MGYNVSFDKYSKRPKRDVNDRSIDSTAKGEEDVEEDVDPLRYWWS